MATVNLEKFPQKKQLFIQSLALGASVGTACKTANVGLTTGAKWRKDSEVQQQVLDLQLEIWLRAQSKLLAHADKAVRCLVDLMGESSPAHVRANAAKAILERVGSFPASYALQNLPTEDLLTIARGGK